MLIRLLSSAVVWLSAGVSSVRANLSSYIFRSCAIASRNTCSRRSNVTVGSYKTLSMTETTS